LIIFTTFLIITEGDPFTDAMGVSLSQESLE